MRTMAKAIVITAVALVQSAHAHPGHPALGATHAHAFLGGDPLYALLMIVAGVVGGAVIILRRRAWRAECARPR